MQMYVEPEHYTQIKIFESTDVPTLEDFVNAFCKEHTVINVRFVSGGPRQPDKVVIVYREFN